jgi:hypothetical protein
MFSRHERSGLKGLRAQHITTFRTPVIFATKSNLLETLFTASLVG